MDAEAFIASGLARIQEALAGQPFRPTPSHDDLLVGLGALLRHLVEGPREGAIEPTPEEPAAPIIVSDVTGAAAAVPPPANDPAPEPPVNDAPPPPDDAPPAAA